MSSRLLTDIDLIDPSVPLPRSVKWSVTVQIKICLLYTSDAADERSSVDLGGRRIIKKKTQKNMRARTTDMDQKRSQRLTV